MRRGGSLILAIFLLSGLPVLSAYGQTPLDEAQANLGQDLDQGRGAHRLESLNVTSVAPFSDAGGWAIVDSDSQSMELLHYLGVDEDSFQLLGVDRPSPVAHESGARIDPVLASELVGGLAIHTDTTVLQDMTDLVPGSGGSLAISSVRNFETEGGWALLEAGTQWAELLWYSGIDWTSDSLNGLNRASALAHPINAAIDPLSLSSLAGATIETGPVDSVAPSPSPVSVDLPPSESIDLDPSIPDPDPATIDPPPAGDRDLDPLVPDPAPTTIDPGPVGGQDLDPLIPDPPPWTVDLPGVGPYDLDPLIPDPPPITIDPDDLSKLGETMLAQDTTPEVPSAGGGLLLDTVSFLNPEGGWVVIEPGTDSEESLQYSSIDLVANALIGVSRPEPLAHSTGAPVVAAGDIPPQTVDPPDPCAPPFDQTEVTLDQCYVPEVNPPPATLDPPDPCTLPEDLTGVRIDPCSLPVVDPPAKTVDVPDSCAVLYEVAGTRADPCYVPRVDGPPVTVDPPDPCVDYVQATDPLPHIPDHCSVPSVDGPSVSVDPEADACEPTDSSCDFPLLDQDDIEDRLAALALGGPADGGPTVGAMFHPWNEDDDTTHDEDHCVDPLDPNTNCAKVLEKLKDAGVQWIRVDLAWASFEPTANGGFNPTRRDQFNRLLEAARTDPPGSARPLKVLPQLWWTPDWATDGPCSGNGCKTFAPESTARFGKFVGWFAEQFGDRVSAYEIWNEPNLCEFWRPSCASQGSLGNGARKLIKLTMAARTAIKAHDPSQERAGEKIVLGGSVFNDDDWFRKIYNVDGARSSFDVLATHPYVVRSDNEPECVTNLVSAPKYAIKGVEKVRQLMKRRQDGETPIWFTEFGWSSHSNSGTTPGYERGVSEAEQADYLIRTIKLIKKKFPRVTRIFWYTVRNKDVDGDDNDPWKVHQDNRGLLNRDLSPKTAYTALKSYLRGGGYSTNDPRPDSNCNY